MVAPSTGPVKAGPGIFDNLDRIATALEALLELKLAPKRRRVALLRANVALMEAERERYAAETPNTVEAWDGTVAGYQQQLDDFLALYGGLLAQPAVSS